MVTAAPHVDGTLHQELGRVVSSEGREIVVDTDGGRVVTHRAASCLLVPAEGDDVVVASLRGGESYVLEVLRHEGDRTLRVEGDLALSVDGHLSLVGGEGIEIATAGRCAVVASEIGVTATEGRVAMGRLELLSDTLRTHVDKARTVVDTLESVAERVTVTAQRVYRTVRDLDQVRAGQIDYEARESMTLQAKNTMVTAEQMLKIDAEQIHLG